MEKGSPKHLRWSVLKKYGVSLKSDGTVFQNGVLLQPDKKLIFGYRDEGPDAWADSDCFKGPIWIWDDDRGWRYWKDEVHITGYQGLCDILVTIKDGVVHVTQITGEHY